MKIKSWNLIVVLGVILSLQWTLIGSIQPAAAISKLNLLTSGEGELDPTFGEGGLVTTDMNKNSGGNAVVLQSDGKIVVAGKVAAVVDPVGGYVENDFALSRYNSDGSLDTSFGANGMVTTDFAAANDIAYAVTLQNDGKIIAVGLSYGVTGTYCALARYDNNGSLDPSFDTDGKATLLYFFGECRAIALQSDGKIVVAGWPIGRDHHTLRYCKGGSHEVCRACGYQRVAGTVRKFHRSH